MKDITIIADELDRFYDILTFISETVQAQSEKSELCEPLSERALAGFLYITLDMLDHIKLIRKHVDNIL